MNDKNNRHLLPPKWRQWIENFVYYVAIVHRVTGVILDVVGSIERGKPGSPGNPEAGSTTKQAEPASNRKGIETGGLEPEPDTDSASN